MENADRSWERGFQLEGQVFDAGDTITHDGNALPVAGGDKSETGWIPEPVMGDVGMAAAQRRAYRRFVEGWQEKMGRDKLEAALVRVKIDAGNQVAGRRPQASGRSPASGG
jgi:hypothetical protein